MFITLFLKNSTKYYSTPSAALYMYLGSKKGKIPYGLATFCIRSNDIYPTLFTLLLYRYKYRTTLFTREVHKYTCHVWNHWNVILQPLKKFRNIPCHKSRDIR